MYLKHEESQESWWDVCLQISQCFKFIIKLLDLNFKRMPSVLERC